MKKAFSTFLLLFLIIIANAQPGKYAGAMKKWINKTFSSERNISGLEGWQFKEASIITNYNDPAIIALDVFQKGTTCIILYSIKEDTAMTEFTIADVIEVKNVANGWQIKTGTCRNNKNENIETLALAKSTNTEYMKTIKKAWRANRDKNRFEVISIKGIDCINEGLD